MNIILQHPKITDVEDYAIWKGIFHAITDIYSETLFNMDSDIARNCRHLYELAYYMEKESKAWELSCEFETQAIVHTFSDSTGWGRLYSDDFSGLMDFDYRVVQKDDLIGQGDHVTVRFKHDNDKWEPVLVKHQIT